MIAPPNGLHQPRAERSEARRLDAVLGGFGTIVWLLACQLGMYSQADLLPPSYPYRQAEW